MYMNDDSHAWGGVHKAAWNKDHSDPGEITIDGNTYRASSTARHDGGLVDVDHYTSSGTTAQHFIYTFQLLRVAAEDEYSAAGYSGLWVTLTFPVPVVITAIYGGYGAVDVTPCHELKAGCTQAMQGSKVHTMRLCSGGNGYHGACPRYTTSKTQLATLELQGERRAPLADDESPASIMAVDVACESSAEHEKLLATVHFDPPPPAPPPPKGAFAPTPPPSAVPGQAYSYGDGFATYGDDGEGIHWVASKVPRTGAKAAARSKARDSAIEQEERAEEREIESLVLERSQMTGKSPPPPPPEEGLEELLGLFEARSPAPPPAAPDGRLMADLLRRAHASVVARLLLLVLAAAAILSVLPAGWRATILRRVLPE